MKLSKIPPILLFISALIIPAIGLITKYLSSESYLPLKLHLGISALLLVGYGGSFFNEFIKRHIESFFHSALFLLTLSLVWIAYKNNFDYMFVTNFQVSYILIGLTHRKIRSVIVFVTVILASYIYFHFISPNPIVPFNAMFPSMILLSVIMGLVTIILMKKDEELANVYKEKDKLLASLQISEKNIRAIFESSQQAFLLIDLDFKVLLFNNTTKIFSRKIIGEEIEIGNSVFPFIIEKYLAEGKKMLFDAKDKGISSSTLGKYKVSGNKYAWIKYHVNPIYDKDEIIGIFVNIQDITEVKSAELELRASNDELKQFAYIVSHDLKEPLRVINSFSQLLSRKLKTNQDKSVTTYLDFITDGAKRMHNLLNDLMSYSTIGKTDNNIEIVDLNQIVEIVQQNLKMNIDESHAVINYANLPKIQGNTSRMIHLFQNFVSNAIKFRKKGENPVIDIFCKENNNSYKISIKDNGIGIAKEHQGKIFEVFKRLHTKAEYKGTGIGLSICQKIVHQLGGNIKVTSAVGEGSIFTISIPIEQKKEHYEAINT